MERSGERLDLAGYDCIGGTFGVHEQLDCSGAVAQSGGEWRERGVERARSTSKRASASAATTAPPKPR